MNRVARSIIQGLTAGLLTLWPLGAAAQGESLGVKEVQAQFSGCGYAVSAPIYWGSLTSFDVRDPAQDRRTAAELPSSDRTLKVLVYPDSPSAFRAYAMADPFAIPGGTAVAEIGASSSIAMRDDHGPNLLPSFTQSVWRQNVAMVQSSMLLLSRLDSAQQDREYRGEVGDFRLATEVQSLSSRAVDYDFVQCLEAALPIGGAPIAGLEISPLG